MEHPASIYKQSVPCLHTKTSHSKNYDLRTIVKETVELEHLDRQVVLVDLGHQHQHHLEDYLELLQVLQRSEHPHLPQVDLADLDLPHLLRLALLLLHLSERQLLPHLEHQHLQRLEHQRPQQGLVPPLLELSHREAFLEHQLRHRVVFLVLALLQLRVDCSDQLLRRPLEVLVPLHLLPVCLVRLPLLHLGHQHLLPLEHQHLLPLVVSLLYCVVGLFLWFSFPQFSFS